MQPQRNRRVSGHVKRAKRKRGDQWYVKYRPPDGRQVQKRLGPVWDGPGRPPEGFYTRRTAEEALQAILVDARRGTLAGLPSSGATFRDATAEYLRYVEQVRKIDIATVKDYRGVIDGYLLAEFGDEPLESITPDMIDVYKERLIAEGRLSSRVIVRHLTVLHGIFKRAGRVWGLERNPASADLVERPRVVYTGEFDTFTAEEVELLAASCSLPRRPMNRTGRSTGRLPSPDSAKASCSRCVGPTSTSSAGWCTCGVTTQTGVRRCRRGSVFGPCP
jgi:integrase